MYIFVIKTTTAKCEHHVRGNIYYFILIVLRALEYGQKKDHTIARLQVILDVCIEISTHATGSAHKLWAELDVDRTAASVPGQCEALMLCH